MTKKDRTGDFKDLRKKAEGKLRQQEKPIEQLSKEEALDTLHELNVHQIELEMQNEQLRQAQAELEESRSKYSDLFDFAPFGYFVLDQKGMITEVNLTGASMLRIERKFLINRPFAAFVDSQDTDSFYLSRREVFQTPACRRCEVRMKREGKDQFIVELLIEPVTDAEDRVTHSRIAMIDITSNKQAEEALAASEERLRLAAEATGFGTYDFDPLTGRLSWSARLCAIMGIRRNMAVNETLYMSLVHPDDRPEVARRVKRSLEPSGPGRHEFEFRIIRPDDEVRWLHDAGCTFYEGQGRDKHAVRVIGTVQDITERKNAEEAIKKSEKKFHALFNSMNEASVLFELIRDETGRAVDCRVLEANQATEKMTGIAPADATGRTMREIFPDVEQFWFDVYGQVETTGEPVTFERRFEPLNRHYRTCVYRPAPGQIAIIFMDITKRKQTEEALKESEERLKLIIDSSRTGTWQWDLQTNQVVWNDMLFEMLGLSLDMKNANAQIFFDHIHPEDRQRVDKSVKEVLKKGSKFEEEFRIIREDGQIRWLSSRGRLHRDKDGKPVRIMGVNYDISEIKRAEEKITDLAKFPAENPYPVMRLAADGTILYSNAPGLLILTEWGCQVGVRAPDKWCNLVKETLKKPRMQVRQVKCGGHVFSFAVAPVSEGGYVNLYGRDITVQEQVKAVLRKSRDELETRVQERTAELVEAVDKLQDEIEQRKRAERSLRERTRDLDAFFSHTITPVVILDSEFNFVRVNKAYADSCGRDISEFAGHNHFEFFPHEENKRIFEEVVRTKTPYHVLAKPFSFPDHPEWGVTYCDWTLVPVLDDTGEVEFLIFSLKDVTEARRAELALKESEEKYRSLVEVSPEAISVVVDGKVVFSNTAGLKLVGAGSAEELIGKSMWDFIHPDSKQEVQLDIQRILQKKKVSPREITMIRPDGSTIEVEAAACPVDHEGKIGILVIFHDISERKREELRKSVTNSLLELFAQKALRKEYLDSVVEIIRDFSGCECVGIRITNDDGHIPYESSIGFDEEFLSLENNLCLHDDVCACIRVIAGTPEPQDAKVMTARGSFHCDNTLSFVDSLSENEKKQYRGTCIKTGFASVAVVPVRFREEILGAIHLADKDKDRVPKDTVEFLEDMASLIGEAVHRFDVEQSLRINQERLLESQRIAHLGNWQWDINSNKLWWSDEVYRIFGLQPQQFGATYEAFLSYVHPEDREIVDEAVNKALYENKPYSIDHRILKPDGSIRVVHEQGETFRDSEGNPLRTTGTVQDITERKRAEERILAGRAALRHLTSQLQLAEESERRRIAVDLHDSIGQILAFSRRELAGIEKTVTGKNAIPIKQVGKELEKAVRQTRTLSFELSPSVLYDLGIEAAIEDLADKFSEERKIRCRCKSNRQLGPMEDAVKVLLYRSVRELLINVAKHAGASQVEITLQKLDNEARIHIEDNGKGFDAGVIKHDSAGKKGFGLFSVTERLNHIGGQLKIESAGGKGTKAMIIVPLGDEDEGKIERN